MHSLSSLPLFEGLLASQPALFAEPPPSPSQDQGRDAQPRFVDRKAAGLSIVTYSGGTEKNRTDVAERCRERLGLLARPIRE